MINFKMQKKNLSQTFLRLLMVLLVLPMAIVNAWAGSGSYDTYLRTVTTDPACGLVYAAKSTTTDPNNPAVPSDPAIGGYKEVMLSAKAHDEESRGTEDMNFEYRKYGIHKYNGGVACAFYGWAQPTRGWIFDKWTGIVYAGSDAMADEKAASPKAQTGSGDLIRVTSWGGGTGDPAAGTAQASWKAASPYTVTYKEPEGGSYSVEYSYQISKQSGNSYTLDTQKETLVLTPESGDKRPYGVNEEQHENGYSYAADRVTLTSISESFTEWKKRVGGVVSSLGVGEGATHSLTYTINENAEVFASFKWAVVDTPDETLVHHNNNVTDKSASVVFDISTLVGDDWTADQFAVSWENKDGNGIFDNVEKSLADGKLTVNFTYNANGEYGVGTTINLVVTPLYGEGATAVVKAFAEEELGYEARLMIEGKDDENTSLALALAHANDYIGESVPTIKIINDIVDVASTLQFKRTMILDLNGKKISSTLLDNLILVQGNTASDKVNLTIIDNSFLKSGEIEAKKSANAVVEAIKVADENKLTLSYVKVHAENKAEFTSNANAKAYGVHIAGKGNVIVLKKTNTKEPDVRISAKSDHDACGFYTEGGFATFQNIAITAEANADAYAFHSNATSNISDAALTATTTTGANAYAAYINGGKSVFDRVNMIATSATTAAYGANVADDGTLIVNGGSISATATSDVYGVCIQSGATANIQVKTNIEVTTTTGADAYGVRNLGTLTLNNITVTATSATNKATAVESKTSALSTTIEDGSYMAISATGTAYGLHHQYGILNVDGGTFSAEAAGNSVYGGRATANATIANATFSAETTGSGNTAYGFVSGTEGITVSLINCTLKSKSATTSAYALFSRANTTAKGCTLEAKTLSGNKAWGFYAENGTNALNSTNAIVEAYTTEAYGVDFRDGILSIEGGTYDVTARQATGVVANSLAYGIKVADGKSIEVSNTTFEVSGSNPSVSKAVYGAYTGSGTISSTNCIYTVDAAKNVYGILGEESSTLNLQNNTITATASATGEAAVYGFYAKGTFGVNGDKITAHAATYPSYSLCFGESAHGDVLGGKFMATGSSSKVTEIIAPINKDASSSNVRVVGGLFYDIPQLRYYVPDGYDIYGVDPAAPEYAEGYYYNVNDHLPYENVCIVYTINNQGNVTGNGTGFPTLAEAFDYARNHSGSNYSIVMTQPYTLPEGNYSLPANATLVVPDKASRTKAQGETPDVRKATTDLVRENRCLTFANGANLDVYGKIEVSAQQFAMNIGSVGYVPGPYGRIEVEAGSTITLNNGAEIFAWGFITGQGEIRVKNGAKVHEDLQIQDMVAASSLTSTGWLSENNKTLYKVFPVSQYYIQNVEAPTKYYYGSQLLGSVNLLKGSSATAEMGSANSVKIVGTSESLFLVTSNDESSWVRKTYDPSTDRIVWETNSSADVGELSISLSGIAGIESKFFVLPINNNMTIHAKTGLLGITQNTVLLPGSEIIIDKTATLQINEKDPQDNDMGLYLYDKSQWSTNATPVLYSPSWINGVCPRPVAASSMKDAAIYVKGKIDVQGAIYTTAGGAAIYSDDTNAGTIEFKKDAAGDGALYKKYDGSVSVPVSSAKLRNGGEAGPDANMTITKDNAEEGDTYAYTNISGSYKWTKLTTVNACVIADETDPSNPIYYAKPQGYVAITSDTEDDKHLFYSVEGEGDAKRKFINMPTDAGCQWWKVTATATEGVYHCATNDTYYKYNTTFDSWEEYTVEVTFYRNVEGTVVQKVLTVNYGAKPDASIVSNPSKNADAAATYQFYGWKSSKTNTAYAYTAELESVTEDMSYLPVFTPITKKYTITFNNAKNGANVPVEVEYGAHPSYDPIKDPTAQYTYYFQNWEGYAPGAELPVVTGAASYTAIWSQTVNKYTITWKNGDDVLETDTKQAYGTATAFNGESLPTKETDDNFVYAFSGWRSSMTGLTYPNGSTPTVAGETTYEAQYSTTPRYKVTFANYDGTELYHEFVTQGEHPIYKGLTPGRARDLDGYFRFIGWKNSEGTDYAPNATLPAVTAKETYTAQYDYVTELYWITFHNVTGKNDLADEHDNWRGKFGVDAIPYYDPNNDDVADVPTKADGIEDGLMYEYTFSGWDPELESVSGEAEYTAQFAKEVKKYNITFANLDGNGAEQTIEVAYGTTPEDLATLVTPEKADNYYTWAFDSWTPALVTVTADAEYTASFQEGVARTFPITFDPDNGDAPIVLNVAYGETPTPEAPSNWQDVANTYTFSGWSPAIHAVDGPAEYTAQYTPTIRTYTITFKNYDGTVLQSTPMNYGATPSYSGTPERPVDLVNLKKYTFTGWSPTVTSVSADAVYTATYSEQNFVATVTPNGGSPAYKSSWSEIFANGSITANCTVKLYADITNPTNNQSISQSMTLDLNGHTISFSASQNGNTQLLNVNNVALTIEDSHGGGVISYRNTRTSNSSQAYVIYVQNNGSVTINGGTIKAERTTGNYESAAIYLYSTNSTLNFNGGELIATENSGGSAYAVYHRRSGYNNNYTYNGKSYINGGKLKAKSGIFQYPRTNNITLSGGYYSSNPGTESGNSQNITIASGYKKVNITSAAIDPEYNNGYQYKVSPLRTIIFQNPDGTPLQTTPQYAEGETPVYSGETPTYADGQYMYTFRAWKAEGDEHEYTTSFPPVTGNTTYVAQYNVVEKFVVNGNTPVENDAAVTTTIVHENGILNVEGGVTLTTTNLILEASEGASGQILDGGTITATNVYYDLTLNTAARHWHAFGVPWAVDLNTNPLTEVETGRTLTLGSNYEIVYYDTHTRATKGPGVNCWKYLKHYDQDGQPIDVLNPGQGYMIAFTSPVQTVRFVKKSDAPIIFNGEVTVTAEGEGTNKGINAIANPMAYHANLNLAGVGQVHDGGEIGSDGYDPVTISNMNYIVGKTVYVQVDGEQTVSVANSKITPAAAPVRRAAKATDKKYMVLEDYYAIELTNANGVGSKLYVLPEEDKEDKYVIGHDLVKMGMSTKKAQIWVNRYGANLGLNTTALINETAEFPINLYAPVAGEYTITNTLVPDEDYTVYLTLNGNAIWNLSSAPYSITLDNGTTKGYGLRLSRKAPQTPTGIDEAVVDAQGETRKVLINNKVYIIRGEKVYSADGQLVK